VKLQAIRHWTFGAVLVVVACRICNAAQGPASRCYLLNPAAFSAHIDRFNRMEDENRTNFISNGHSWDWLRENVPFFECPDQEVEELYYFRWWSFRKHLVQTPKGFVFTEFLVPVGHAGAFNTISCAAGHHLMEGRWLRDPRYVNEYILFWLRDQAGKPPPHFHRFSSWFAWAVYQCFLVNPDLEFVTNLVDDLAADYRVWERERQATNGLFWQYDVRDGMEESISGSRTAKNIRPTINSYMYGNASAIGALARRAGRSDLAAEFERKAAELKRGTIAYLWNRDARFFEVRDATGGFSGVREAIGFIPWYFGLAEKEHESAWSQFTDADGFRAPYGITTAERRHPRFRSHGCCKCEWDGAVWPFATSQTLSGLANLLCDGSPANVTRGDYFTAFLNYVHSQRFEGKPYIGEYLDETTGQWLKGKQERSRYYNHSTFADLLISGVVGLRPDAEGGLSIAPLVPENTWAWFCLDAVKVQGHTLTILWDRDGRRYGKGKGLMLLKDGELVAKNDSKIRCRLN
jgi:hypothetical protein